ncbi:hypothetical protein F511_03956 [Dorcoceras hygrometricum]|uniref:Uncharacterized protein n=1 Tax=Dorcoceras hygrometricum TaxID=472368 RepID=A0A2Z7BZL2_9LAMI|nr:hypothetical protein F511_03956 [Dorcoceras hygrometricum]
MWFVITDGPMKKANTATAISDGAPSMFEKPRYEWMIEDNKKGDSPESDESPIQGVGYQNDGHDESKDLYKLVLQDLFIDPKAYEYELVNGSKEEESTPQHVKALSATDNKSKKYAEQIITDAMSLFVKNFAQGFFNQIKMKFTALIMETRSEISWCTRAKLVKDKPAQDIQLSWLRTNISGNLTKMVVNKDYYLEQLRSRLEQNSLNQIKEVLRTDQIGKPAKYR